MRVYEATLGTLKFCIPHGVTSEPGGFTHGPTPLLPTRGNVKLSFFFPSFLKLSQHDFVSDSKKPYAQA